MKRKRIMKRVIGDKEHVDKEVAALKEQGFRLVNRHKRPSKSNSLKINDVATLERYVEGKER